jgi:hypothetical protein
MLTHTTMMNINKSRYLLSTLFPLALALSPFAEAESELSVDRGPALAGRISASAGANYKQLVAGNGDASLMWTGTKGNFTLYFGKSDFWGVVRGNFTGAGGLNLVCDEVREGQDFSAHQNLGPATITTHTKNGTAELNTRAWVAYPENLIVTELSNSGSVPLHFHTRLDNALASDVVPVCQGADKQSTWQIVSPDLVQFELGNRPKEKVTSGQRKPLSTPFSGRIAGVEITSPEYPQGPFLSWNPKALTASIGTVQIEPSEHGDAVLFTANENKRMNCAVGEMPESAFSFTAWINPSEFDTDQTVFAGVASEADKYPYFRGFLVHLLNGVPEVRWNYFTATGTSALPRGQWSEIKAVYENQLLTLFVNGKQVAQGDNPPAEAQMGWDKCVLRTGDPKIPFNGCAPQAMLRQSICGAVPEVSGQSLNFTVEPGQTVSLLVSLVSDRNTADYLQVAAKLSQSTKEDLARLKTAHASRWNAFWGKSFIEIPDQAVMANWYGSLYALACCSRADCPAPGLWYNFVRGVNCGWQGDYTLNYNYQAPFWAGLCSNHLELTDNYDSVLLDHIGRGRTIAQNAWRMNSMRFPASLDEFIAQRALPEPSPNHAAYKGIFLYAHLIPLPGWSIDLATFHNQKSGALFCALNMIMRWRLTHDLTYAEKVYPFLKGTAEFWDDYLVLKDGRYVSLNDAVAERSGDNTNPATTISFLKLFYPSLLEISRKLNRDAGLHAKWQDIIARLSPFTYVPASSISSLQSVSPEILKNKMVIRDCEADGPDFPQPAFNDYHDQKARSSSPGMSCVQTVFPGWSFGLESTPQEREAALNTVTFAAQWFDNNNCCNFYADAAITGYDPKEILKNMDALIANYQRDDFTIVTKGGGTEDVAIVPCALHHMFLQSHQKDIHLFPNWPKDLDASFGDLPACGGFTISSKQKGGKILYVQVHSTAGEVCRIANPWPGKKVLADSGTVFQGDSLEFPTSIGQTLLLTPAQD